MERVSAILKQYINKKIPQKATNIFWQMFNGIDAIFQHFEIRLDIFKRERNMLTAQHLTSLRNLASMNGFEPVLKEPATGILQLSIASKLFNRVGYPLYIVPYASFTDKDTKIKYYYDCNTPIKIGSNKISVPVSDGEIKTVRFVGTYKNIDRFYITDSNISTYFTVKSANSYYFEVKSFSDNDNVNDNKQFLIKYSSDIQNPIAIYIRGLAESEEITISYKLCVGEFANISGKNYFETNSIINSFGDEISLEDDDIEIINLSGFKFGSDGTDENALRSAIGYNHGHTLLYDTVSYSNFIAKYSTILLQKIESDLKEKSIKHIWVSKKHYLGDFNSNPDIILQYKNIVTSGSFHLNEDEKILLTDIINEHEYCLASHNLYNAVTNRFAFQIEFNTIEQLNQHSLNLSKLLYSQFAIFFINKYHQINIELLIEDYMKTNKINIKYLIFNEREENKLIQSHYIINANEFLPIIQGNFNITDSNNNTFLLFTDINFVLKWK